MLQDNYPKLPMEIYTNHLRVIRNIKFTQREIDIISCLLSGRALKKVGNILSISPKTVETHTRNIMLKLECNSREGIIDFIEKAGKISLLKEYYLSIVTQAIFEQQLKKIARLIESSNPSCVFLFQPEDIKAEFNVKLLETHLSLAGIHTSRILSENKDYIKQHKVYIIYDLENYSLENLLRTKETSSIGDCDSILNSSSVTFLLDIQNGDVDQLRQSYEKKKDKILDFHKYYHSLFILIKTIISPVNIDQIIEDFNEKLESPTFEDKSLESKEITLKKDNRAFYNFTESLKMPIRWLIMGIFLIVCTVLAFSLKLTDKSEIWQSKQKSLSIRSDLALPASNVLLERPQLMNLIKESFKMQEGIQAIALVGIGGAGKTTIARQYASLQKSSVTWEFNANTRETLIRAFESLAYSLAITEEDKRTLKTLQEIKNSNEREEKISIFVKERLKVRPNWLLIYDNVEKYSEIQNYFPTDSDIWGKGKVVITTRNSNISNSKHLISILNISELTEDEKLNLFEKIMGSDAGRQHIDLHTTRAINFLKALPSFPLDIITAAYYLKATGTSYEKYLAYLNAFSKDFNTTQENILKEESVYTKTRYNVISLSLREIINSNKEFTSLLLLLSLLDSRAIPRQLLDAYKNDAVIDNFIFYLRKYSFLASDSRDMSFAISSLSIHQSTQRIMLANFVETLGLEANKKPLQHIFNFLNEYVSGIIENDDYMKMRQLEPHIVAALNHSNLITDSMRGSLGGELGYIYCFQGKHKEAKEILEASLKYLNRSSSENKNKIARVLLHLGCVEIDEGNYTKAKDLIGESYKMYQENLGVGSSGVARTLSRLGVIEIEIGNCEKAIDLLEKSLKIKSKLFGKDSLQTSGNLLHLGNAYRCTGNYERAMPFVEKSLEIYRKNYGNNHVEVAWALSNLGYIHQGLGNYEEAQKSLETSLTIYSNALSKEHLYVGGVMTRLGNIYNEIGNYEKARQLLEKSLWIFEKKYNKDHVQTVWPMICLGVAYEGIGNHKYARDQLNKCFMIYKKSYPINHPKMAWIILNLGKVELELGNFEDAKNLFKQSLSIYEKTYGKMHLGTARSLYNLGRVYLLQGRLDKAEDHFTQLLAIQNRLQHPEHYLCLECMADLCLKKSNREIDNKNNKSYTQLRKCAIDYLKQSLTIVKARYPKNSPHIERIQQKLKDLGAPERWRMFN